MVQGDDPSQYENLYMTMRLADVGEGNLEEPQYHTALVKPCHEMPRIYEYLQKLNLPSTLVQVAHKAWCIDAKAFKQATNKTLNLVGQLATENYNLLQVFVKKCSEIGQEKNDGSDCLEKLKAEMRYKNEEFLDNSKKEIRLGIPTFQINPQNYENPFQLRLQQIITQIYGGLTSLETLEMQNLTVETEVDLTQFDKTEKTQKSNSYLKTDGVKYKDEQIVIQYNILLSEENKIVKRTYSNFLVILANVFGLLNFLQTAARLFFNFAYTNITEMKLVDTFISLPKNQDKITLLYLNCQLYFQEYVTSAKENNIKIVQMFQLFKNNYSELNSSLSVIKQILSLEQLLQSFYDICILKHLLLNDSQRQLIKYINKPKIRKTQRNDITSQQAEESQYQKLEQDLLLTVKNSDQNEEVLQYETFKKIKDSGTQIDNNILALIDPNLIQKWNNMENKMQYISSDQFRTNENDLILGQEDSKQNQ